VSCFQVPISTLLLNGGELKMGKRNFIGDIGSGFLLLNLLVDGLLRYGPVKPGSAWETGWRLLTEPLSLCERVLKG
jgi:hypothetical protein